MRSRWNDEEAAEFDGDPLSLRVYSSRLLGSDPSLVLHGGGNTSVKATARDIFGGEEEVLYVKGSGWDLATIEAPGFAPVRLNALQRMATLEGTERQRHGHCTEGGIDRSICAKPFGRSHIARNHSLSFRGSFTR